MKKVTIFILVLVVALFSISCQKQINKNQQEYIELYTVLIDENTLNTTNLDFSKYDRFSMRGEQYTNANASGERKETILNDKYILRYLYSASSSVYDKNLDYYYDNSSNCQVAYSSLTGKLSRIESQDIDGKIITCGQSMADTDSYFIWLKNVINDIFGINIDSYNFSARTYFSGGLVENSFVPSQSSEDSQVAFYYFEYAKYIGEYKSTEAIKLIIHPDGSVQSIIHSEIPYQSFEEVIVEEGKLKQTIEKTVSEICPPKYIIKGYSVKSMVWIYYEGAPCLTCGVEIMTTDILGEEFGYSIILAILP